MRKVLAFLALASVVGHVAGCRKDQPAPVAAEPKPAPAVQQAAVALAQVPSPTEDPAQPSQATLDMRTAIEAIGNQATYSPEAEARLLAALKHPDQDVRGHAAWGLGRLAPQSKAAIPQLILALSDPVWAVQHNAAWALVRFSTEARPALQQALKDSDVRRRVRAGKALLEIGADQTAVVEPVLLAAWPQADTDDVRAVILEALGMLQPPGPATLQQLAAALDTPLAGVALGSLARQGPAAVQTVPAVVKVTQSKDKDLRLAAAVTLGEIGVGSAEATGALAVLLDDAKEHVSASAAGALSKLQAHDVLATALQSPSERVRQNAARGLAGTPQLDERRVHLLLQAMTDKAWSVRLIAVGAFHGHDGPVVLPAVPALGKALKDEHEAVRAQARASLEQMKNEPARKLLIKAGK